MAESRSRKWQITINNPLEHNFTDDSIESVIKSIPNVIYYCMCNEIGEQGTPHVHIFIICKNAVRFTTLHNLFPPAHLEVCKGNNQENYDYIRKEGKHKNDTCKNLINTFREFGELPPDIQGKRNDLTKLYDMVSEGLSNYDIISEDTSFISRIDLIDKVRNTILGERFKTVYRHLYVEYVFGSPGVGKTRYVMDKYGYDKVYHITDYDHPWDMYQGQDVILFEEFRSSLKITNMLNYLDGYPLQLPARYGNKIACYTKVYIVTNVPLIEQYAEVQLNSNITYQAFLRRINYVFCMDEWTTGIYTKQIEFDEDLPL